MKQGKPLYRRVMIKLSGESLMGNQNFGIEHTACKHIATSIKRLYDESVSIGIVIGGGNIFRGNQAESFGFKRTPADHIGMLGTTINGLVLQQSLSTLGCNAVAMNAFECDGIIEKYNWHKAMEYLDSGRIVIFVGGTSNPYFTTDTAAALRASEINAEILLKGTKVDGIYDKDPMKYPDAKKFPSLSYSEVFTKQLNVMDATAIALCRENLIPIYVFNLFEEDALHKAVFKGEGGSLVMGE